MAYQSIINNFEEKTREAFKLQRETLKKILEENGDVEYLNKYGLQGRTDEESFKGCVPLALPDDFEPFITRIADGDSSPILTKTPTISFSLSSGTSSGKPKLVPFNVSLCRSLFHSIEISEAFLKREFSINEKDRFLNFSYAVRRGKTRGGINVGPFTTNVLYDWHLLEKVIIPRKMTPCSPHEVSTNLDHRQALYCHLVCAIVYANDIQFIRSSFAYTVVNGFRAFEQLWEDICSDIRTGILGKRIMDPSLRESISSFLKPDPILADDISKKCTKLISKNWVGLIPLLFPYVKFVKTILTGSMEPYVDKLREYAGEVPLVCWDYMSSEGGIGINVRPRSDPKSVVYTIVPDSAYFEFIPLKNQPVYGGDPSKNSSNVLNNHPPAVGLTEVEVGEEYEVVITNSAGLYRYRIGDVVKAVGFYNSTPEFKYVCRKGVMLSIFTEKVSEKHLQFSILQSTKILSSLEGRKVELVDFSSHADTSTQPGHYVIFWELTGEASKDVLQSCSNCIDRSFNCDSYDRFRRDRSIGDLELRIVEKGTFQKVQEHYRSLGTSLSQYKTPRCIISSNVDVLQILNDHVLMSFTSDPIVS